MPLLAFGIPAGNCHHNSLRLTGGNQSSQSQTMNGRLELCFNNAWGTVCNKSFRAIDAQVACNQLVGFEREGIGAS